MEKVPFFGTLKFLRLLRLLRLKEVMNKKMYDDRTTMIKGGKSFIDEIYFV